MAFPSDPQPGDIYTENDVTYIYSALGWYRSIVALKSVVRPAGSIDDLTDADTSTSAPSNGQALIWDQPTSQWRPGSVATTAQGALADTALQPTSSIDALADVDTSTTSPTDGQVLTWDQTAGQWTPAGIPPASLSTLDGIGNVDTATIPKQAGNALVWSGSKWVASQTNLAYTNSEGVDVNYNNTVLLLNFDHPAGTGSAGVVDISPSSKTFSGTGNITASPVKAGSGAWGSGSLTVNDTTGFTVNTGAGEALTIEFWAYSGDLASSRNLLNVRSTSSFTTTRIRIDTLGKISWATGLTSSINTRITHPATIPVNTWFHVALTRQIGSASWRLHVDGVASSASTVADSFSAENSFQIGVDGVFIDLFRFTKGVARYGAATFTPSSTPFVAGNGFTPSSINTFDDVDTSTVTPTNGQALVWDQITGKWMPRTSVLSTVTGITGATAITNCVAISQVDYDAIAVKDPNTLYVIV